MRRHYLALLVLAIPAFAQASASVSSEQCAAYTAMALQEGRYQDVADLFSTPGKPASKTKDETKAKLSSTFARFGKLSDIQAGVRRPDGPTMKLEVTDGTSGFPLGKYGQTSHSIRGTVGGVSYLDISYHLGQPHCALIAVAVHVPRSEAGNAHMEFTYETGDEAKLDQFVAMLREHKIGNYSIKKTSVNTDGKASDSWTLTTLPFPVSENPATAMKVAEPFHKIKGKSTFTFSYSISGATGKSSSPH